MVTFVETRFPRSTSVSSYSTSSDDFTKENGFQPSDFSSIDPDQSTKLLIKAIASSRNMHSLPRTISNCYNADYYNKLKNSEILDQLRRFGIIPGPITETTRIVYLKMLISLSTAKKTKERSDKNQKSIPAVGNTLLSYPEELRVFISNPNISWQDQFIPMEQELRSDFDQPGITWRGGTNKTAFNYLLLDSRLTKNLPNRLLTSVQQMEIFIQAIFYVGKGTRTRPLAHLYEAASAQKENKITACDKIKKICEIWKSGCGVVNLYCFQNVIPVEAFTREACMICALGVKNITNARRGECYGAACQWPLKKKRIFGVFLLFRALNVLLNEGERQISLADIKK